MRERQGGKYEKKESSNYTVLNNGGKRDYGLTVQRGAEC